MADYFLLSDVTRTLLVVIGLSCAWSVWRRVRDRRRYPPGPVGLPLVGYLPFLGLSPHKTLWKLREKYGDIMSMYLGTKYTIILSDFNIVKEVLSHPSSLNRSPQMFAPFPYKGFQAINGEPWLEQRRFVLTISRNLGLGRTEWEDLISDEVDNFLDDLRATEGKASEILQPLAISVSSNILSLLIGRKLDRKEEMDTIELALEFSKKSFLYLGPSEPANLVPGLRKFLEYFRILGYDRVAQTIESFGQFIKTEIDKHKISPEVRSVQDFINSYLNKLDELSIQKNGRSHSFSERMLQGNLIILFMGATDTIFSSMSWLTMLMAEHEDIQERVHQELIDVLGKEGRARYLERHRIPYTYAVMLEAQRYSTIVPLGTTRVLSEDYHINGYVLPKGAEIFPNVWGIHFDTRYWKEPQKFMPERFLSSDGKLLKNVPGFTPFSLGRRSCPGQTIAWMEIMCYFTQIMMKFRIRLPEGAKAKYEVLLGLVCQIKPQPLCYEERQLL